MIGVPVAVSTAALAFLMAGACTLDVDARAPSDAHWDRPVDLGECLDAAWCAADAEPDVELDGSEDLATDGSPEVAPVDAPADVPASDGDIEAGRDANGDVARDAPWGVGLRGDYFSDPRTSNWRFFRVDPNINFDWGRGPAHPTLPADNFSVRWTGTITAEYSETYTFFVHCDDGVRLWVDEHQLVEQWYAPSGRDFSGTIPMVAGKEVEFKVEYFEAGGDAAMRVEWASDHQAREVIPSSRFLPAAMD